MKTSRNHFLLFVGFASIDFLTAQNSITLENVSNLLGSFTQGSISLSPDSGEGLHGVSWFDYDNDGDLDLFLCSTAPLTDGLFRNNGDGTFTDVTALAGVTSTKGHSGVVTGDINNDGYVDIFLTGQSSLVAALDVQGPTTMYLNNGDGTFTDITDSAGLPGPETAFSAAMADVDNDGYLDIFVVASGHIPMLFKPGASHSNKLYRNNGDLTFTDITDVAGVDGLYTNKFNETVSDGACVVTFTDYNRDGYQDILVGNCNAFPSQQEIGEQGPVRPTPINLFRNNGDGTFDDVAEEAGITALGFWMGLAMGDYNNDGYIDFFATSSGSFSNSPHVLYRNNGDGTFAEVGEEAGIPLFDFSWGATFADFDNDGDLDLYVVGAYPLFGTFNKGVMFSNNGDGTFAELATPPEGDLSTSYTSGLAHGDYDGDGFPDVIVSTVDYSDIVGGQLPEGAATTPVLLRNKGNNNSYLTVRPVGVISNRDGIGAIIEVDDGTKIQAREVIVGSSMASTVQVWPSFGLGEVWRRKVMVTITWPSGLRETFRRVNTNQVVELVEGTSKRIGSFATHKTELMANGKGKLEGKGKGKGKGKEKGKGKKKKSSKSSD